MILGIATSLTYDKKIRMDFFDDNEKDSIKTEYLEEDCVYNIKYYKDGSIYETICKIKSIHEDPTIVINCNTGFVRECIEMNDSVYYSKDSFMKMPPIKNITLVVDTSETFTGRYETLHLADIRDCDFLYGPRCGGTELHIIK